MRILSLFIVVLNYNNATDTIECLQSLKLIKNYELHIVLVDNGSNDECVEIIRKHITDDITFIETGENLGYAAGNNIGIKYAVEHDADYIAILNNDVVVNSDSFSSCIKLLELSADIAIAGPAILEFNSNVIQSAGANIDFKKLKTPLIRHGEIYSASTDIIDCDYIGGACMMFRSDLVNKIGYLPENYFLFWEETEWCCKAKNLGLRVICSMEASVNHKGSATIKKISGISSYYMERNKVIFSIRNAPKKYICIYSIAMLLIKNIYRGIFINKGYFKFVRYYYDGIVGANRMSF